MLQPHTQLPLIMVSRCAAAMLLVSFGRRTWTLARRSLNGLRLPDRSYSGGLSNSASLTICPLGSPFTLLMPSTEIPMAGFPRLVEVSWSSKRTSHVAVCKRDWRLDSASQSLSNRQEIDPRVRSRLVEVRSESSVPLILSRSNCQPSALTSPHSPGNSFLISPNE